MLLDILSLKMELIRKFILICCPNLISVTVSILPFTCICQRKCKYFDTLHGIRSWYGDVSQYFMFVNSISMLEITYVFIGKDSRNIHFAKREKTTCLKFTTISRGRGGGYLVDEQTTCMTFISCNFCCNLCM